MLWVWLKPLKVSLSQKMFTRFERILKLFLSPLLSTFKLYNTQPNLQQKSAMVWQGFMLQVRLQRFFFASLKGNSIFVRLSSAKTWKIEIAFVNEIFFKSHTICFFGSNCAFIILYLVLKMVTREIFYSYFS